jgi:hypothetical protein
LLNGKFVDGIIQCDNGFQELRADRSSPAFWEVKKKEVFAVIHQLGCPTFFFSCLAAETKWTELTVILYQLLNKTYNNGGGRKPNLQLKEGSNKNGCSNNCKIFCEISGSHGGEYEV